MKSLITQPANAEFIDDLELRRLRAKRGLSQKQVADYLGYESAQFISNWERGLSYVPPEKFEELSDLYKVSVSSLFYSCMLITEEKMIKKITGQR